MLVELVKLALNYGVYAIPTAVAPPEVEGTLREWQPHLLIVDMDLDGPRGSRTSRARRARRASR